MIVFPLIAVLVAFACALFVGWGVGRHPRPEGVVWTVAFAVFSIGAGAEVVGSAMGWSAPLVRLYYLTGAVLVVGILALGEIYLLFPGKVSAIAPGLAILIVAIATTAVWSAPINSSRLQSEGWNALVRDPFLIVLTVIINAGGTLVLVGGTLFSAWRIHSGGGSQRRAVGCGLIAGGAVVVAMGGTLTRFGHREYLYLAMAVGVVIILGGVVLTGTSRRTSSTRSLGGQQNLDTTRSHRAPIAVLPRSIKSDVSSPATGEAVRYVVDRLLPLDDGALQAACQRWSATPVEGEAFTRQQAIQVWALRLALPTAARGRYDDLAPQIQAQLAELYAEVWSNLTAVS